MASVPDIKLATAPGSVAEHLERLANWLGALHEAGTFNGTVLIAKDGQVRFEKHYGSADVAGAVPLTGKSSFSIASVSKPFTALGIMLLARNGKLTLDDLLSQHVPETAFLERITLRQLLHHTSGIPDHVDLADLHWIENRLLTMPDVLSLFVKHRPRAYFPPGDTFEYSNTGYVFLGEVIARVSKSSYPAFMADAIFKPLGMDNTAAYNLTVKQFPLPARVYGMRRNFGKLVLCDLNFFDGTFGDGGIYASAEDLLRWDTALRQGSLLPVDVYQEAYVPGRLNSGASTSYGFGWEIGSAGVVEHWGEWEGFAAHMHRDLRQNVMLVALSNLGPASKVDPICRELAAYVERLDWSGATS